jgi:hypothetical protein
VQQSRALTAATFPLPSVLDCIRYAITELAEYDDALLRAERTGDKRNNDKQHDPRSELGQALYMLLSAAVQLGHEPEYFSADGGVTESYLDAVSTMAIVGYDVFKMSDVPWTVDLVHKELDDAYSALLDLSDVCGWPVDALIDDTCAAFERKHAPVEVR